MAGNPKKNDQVVQERKRILQVDIPSYPLTQALRVSQAIADHLGLRPSRPLQVAQAMEVQPTSGPFRLLCGASIAYGLTDGGYNTNFISVTALGRRIVAPTAEGDDAVAMREAMLKPRIVKDFLQRYDGAKVPREDVARNVLVELGAPRDTAERALRLILEGARTVGFLREINGTAYIDLQGSHVSTGGTVSREDQTNAGTEDETEDLMSPAPPLPSIPKARSSERPRVFISHGRNMHIVEQIKTMLNVAELEYEIAVEEQATAIPVPEKVLGAMRKCTGAVICVTPDSATGNSTDAASTSINQNVLIEIGAAFVLYDKRVVLLWDKRVPVPSNLQGLFRCEFQGDELSWSAGMKLMEAVKKFKST